jgi:hypothetical protein
MLERLDRLDRDLARELGNGDAYVRRCRAARAPTAPVTTGR